MNMLWNEIGEKSAGNVQNDMRKCNCFRSELTDSWLS